jgi:Protein of unknown function (DUF2938)
MHRFSCFEGERVGSDLLIRAIIVGAVAVALFDLWGWTLQRFFGVRAQNWAILGKWLMAPFAPTRAAAPAGGPLSSTTAQKMLGTAVHLATGIVFAVGLLLLAGPSWASRPTPLPAIATGLGTIVFAWFVIMPALGHGPAASKTPFPGRVRALTIMAHFVFGIGFFLGALVATLVL